MQEINNNQTGTDIDNNLSEIHVVQCKHVRFKTILVLPLSIMLLVSTFFILKNNYFGNVTRPKSPEYRQTIITPESTNQKPCEISEEEKYVNKTEIKFSDELVLNDVEKIKINLLLNNEKPFFEDILNIEGEIVTYNVSPSNNLVGFIVETTKPIGTPIENGDRKARSVYIYNFDNKDLLKIYELDNQLIKETSNYTVSIWDINFSSDSSLLAITTSTGISIYNIEMRSLVKLFDNPPLEAAPKMMGIWAYSSPEFSYNNKLLKYSERYSEGSTDQIYDLENRRLIKLNYHNYVNGKIFLAWYSSKILAEFNVGLEDGLYIIDPFNLGAGELLLQNSSTKWLLSQPVIVGDWIYYYVYEEGKSGTYSCFPDGTKFEDKYTYKILKRYNLRTREGPVDIMVADQTYFDRFEAQGKHLNYTKLYLEGTEKLLIGISYSPIDVNKFNQTSFTPDEYYIVNDDLTLTKLTL